MQNQYPNSMVNDSLNILHRFGGKVKTLRKESNFSQEKLAEISSLHRTYIGMIERGERNISLKNIEKLSKALNVSISELTGDVDG